MAGLVYVGLHHGHVDDEDMEVGLGSFRLLSSSHKLSFLFFTTTIYKGI